MDLFTHLMTLMVALASSPAPPPASPAELELEKAGAGATAAQLFFTELGAHLEAGYAVSSLQTADDGDLVVELVGAEVVVLEAGTDPQGRVVRTQVFRRPRDGRDSRASLFPVEQELAAEWLPQMSTSAVVVVEELDDGPALVARDRTHPSVVVKLGAIADDELVID